jgi:hypothetical protein
MEDGLRFAIREGGRTVGAGVVAKVIEQIDEMMEKAPFGAFSIADHFIDTLGGHPYNCASFYRAYSAR